jgi:hypothetical protein
MVSRRHFLKLGSVALASGFFIRDKMGGEQAAPQAKTYKGPNLADWKKTLGDSIYNRPGEEPVSLADDIKTIHQPGYSELRANIQRRVIMAHNITFKRIIDPQARSYIHTCSYEFRLPFIPEETNTTLNAETLEGAIFVWDGANTRRDFGIGFQWALNPSVHQEFGDIRTWTDIPDPEKKKPGTWVKTGKKLTPDRLWHKVQMIVDFRRKTTALLIDNKHYLSYLTKIRRPPDWGPEVAARLQAEIVSIYPEPAGMQAMHKAQFRNWVWKWEPSTAADPEAEAE